jgi:hypothetical protein
VSKKNLAFLVALIIVVAVPSANAVLASGDSGSTIQVCVSKKTKQVKYFKNRQSCPNNHFAVSIGEEGPQGLPGSRGAKGATGENGDSAYEIAQKQGFEGSESEWLETLYGEPFELQTVFPPNDFQARLLTQNYGDEAEIIFRNLEVGVYSVQLWKPFDNLSPNTGTVSCAFFDSTMDGSGTNSTHLPYFRIRGTGAVGEESAVNFFETETFLMKVYADGDYGLYCNAGPFANGGNPEIYSTGFVGYIHRLGDF